MASYFVYVCNNYISKQHKGPVPNHTQVPMKYAIWDRAIVQATVMNESVYMNESVNCIIQWLTHKDTFCVVMGETNLLEASN